MCTWGFNEGVVSGEGMEALGLHSPRDPPSPLLLTGQGSLLDTAHAAQGKADPWRTEKMLGPGEH